MDHRWKSRRVAATAVLAMLVVGGCNSSAGEHTSHGRRSAHTVTATDADNGHTVELAVGDRLVVRLASTYWTFAGVASGPLVKSGAASVSAAAPSAAGRCVAGQGCGSVSETFVAASPGRVVVSAGRTSCGEALRCTGPAGTYRVTLVIS
jgi:hypothetical protein